MRRLLLIFVPIGVLMALFLGGLKLALIVGVGMILAMAVIWNMPCGKAGMMVLFGSIALVYLSSIRETLGEVGFWLILLWTLTAFFLTYKKAALDGEAGCGAVCPIDVES
ncbi:MAG: hypothetical protein GXO39_08625 [Thermotogae bacterium]|nr:hypothetical protein [Thermotogota bacterium]